MTARDIVRREQARAATHVAAVHAGWGAGLALAALSAMVLALGRGRWLELPPALPLVLWALLLGAAIAGVWRTVSRLRRVASANAAARSLETDRGLRSGSVVGVSEMDSAMVDPFVRRAAAAIGDRISSAKSDAANAARARSRVTRAALALLGGLVLLGGASSAAPDGWKVINHPVAAANGDMLKPLTLSGAPRSVLRGSALSVLVAAPDRRWVRVHHRVAGRGWTSRTVRVDGGRSSAAIGVVTSPTWVYASDARGASDTVLIGVTDKPYLGDVAIQAVYPGYLRRPSEPVDPTATIVIPRGTVLTMRGRGSVPLRDVALASAGRATAFPVEGYAFSGSLAPAASGVWAWRAGSQSGGFAELPPELRIEIEPDHAPAAEIISPASDTTVSAGALPQVVIGATDDHGLARVDLSYWKQGQDGRRSGAIGRTAGAGNVPVWRAQVPLAVAAAPGDEIHVLVTATDASPWSQRAVSAERVIRIATVARERETARDLADSAVSAALAAAAAQRRLEQQTSAESRARSDREAGGSTPRADRARAMAAEQRALMSRADELRATSEALESSLRSASALDSELAARLQEVRQLLRTALSPAMMRSVEELERSQRDPGSAGFQEALRDLAAQQRRMREQLERVVEMLRRAAIEGSLQTLSDDARELAAAESASRAEASSELRERSRQLVQNITAVQEQLRAQQARAGQARTSSALNSARASTREIEQSSADMQAASRSMNDAAESLASARSEQIQEWKSELTSDLDLAVQELIQIAREQQALASRVESGPGGSRDSWRPDQATLQQGAAAASDRVTRAARRSTLITPRSQAAAAAAAQKVARVSATQIPGGPEAAALMRDAAGALNQAAASLVRDRERTASARSASGFTELLEELQRLAREQGALNGEAGALSLQMNAGAQGGDRVRALARQQRSIASRLEDVAGSAEGGRASALADEARRIAERLEASGLDANAVARQQQLYRRMLDAGRTLTRDERDSTAGRRAERATAIGVFTPARGIPDRERGFREPTWAELRGLSAEERQLVIDYFRRINAKP